MVIWILFFSVPNDLMCGKVQKNCLSQSSLRMDRVFREFLFISWNIWNRKRIWKWNRTSKIRTTVFLFLIQSGLVLTTIVLQKNKTSKRKRHKLLSLPMIHWYIYIIVPEKKCGNGTMNIAKNPKTKITVWNNKNCTNTSFH